MTGKNKFIVKFEDIQKRKMSYVSFLCVFLEEEVYLDTEKPLSGFPLKEKVNC